MGKVVKSIFGGGSSSSSSSAMKESNDIARKQAQLAEEQMNAANAKEPDIDSIKSDNASGLGSTMLTGTEGAEVEETNKKRKTLLGE